MEAATKVSRQQLLASFEGHSLNIPDLQVLLSHWPQYVNSELEHLRQDVDEQLHTCVEGQPSIVETAN